MLYTNLVQNALVQKCLSCPSLFSVHTPHGREPPSDTSLRIRNKAITKSTSVKFLGIVIQEHLWWKEHVESIIQKVRASTAAVRRVKNYLYINTLLLLYRTLVMSHISYCISA